MNLKTRRAFLLTLMVPLTMGACSKSSPSEDVAKQFMTAYYVKMDMKGAEAFTDDLAKEKLTKQIGLLDGQAIGPGTQVPTVDVSLNKQVSVTPEEATYIFEVIPNAPDVGHRKVFVKLRQSGGQWKVTQFLEGDQVPAIP